MDRWWLTQASVDIVKDRALMDLMERSGCIGIFLGIESLDEVDLKSVRKRQNKTAEYKRGGRSPPRPRNLRDGGLYLRLRRSAR